MNPVLLGAVILYGPIALASAVFWTGVYFWVRDRQARDVMKLLRPSAADVAATERKLGISR